MVDSLEAMICYNWQPLWSDMFAQLSWLYRAFEVIDGVWMDRKY